MTLEQWIDLHLALSGLSFGDAAKKIGSDHYSIRAWASGKHEPMIRNLIALCEVFGFALNRRPTQLFFECVTNMQELKNADQRWMNQQGCKNEQGVSIQESQNNQDQLQAQNDQTVF